MAVNDQSSTVVGREVLSADAVLKCHQDFVVRKLLNDVTESRNTGSDNVCQHICRNAFGAFQNENNKGDKELDAAVDSLWDFLQQVGEYAEEK